MVPPNLDLLDITQPEDLLLYAPGPCLMSGSQESILTHGPIGQRR